MATEEESQVILDCVDRGLATFGKEFKKVVYGRFFGSCGLARNDILARPEEFRSFLQNTFGKGSKVIEREIASEIGLYCGLLLKDPFDMVEAIQHAKSQILIA